MRRRPPSAAQLRGDGVRPPARRRPSPGPASRDRSRRARAACAAGRWPRAAARRRPARRSPSSGSFQAAIARAPGRRSRCTCRGTRASREVTKKPCAKPGRHPELALVLGRERHADPPAEGGRRAAHVDRHVEDLAGDHAHQLALRRAGAGSAGRAGRRAPSASGCPARSGGRGPSPRGTRARLKVSRKKPRSSPKTSGSMSRTPGRSVGDRPSCESDHSVAQDARAGTRRSSFLRSGSASARSCAASMQPMRKAISSRQAIFSPCRSSMVWMKLRGLEQRLVRAGVEPGDAAAQHLDAELAPLEVGAVDVGDLELAARARASGSAAMSSTLVVVEVEARHRVVRLGACRASPRCETALPVASNSTTP